MSDRDDAGRRAPQFWSRTLGDLRLTHLPDGDIEVRPTGFFTSTTTADWDAYPQLVNDDGHVVAGAGGVLVERDGVRVLIDAGLGPMAVDADSTPDAFGAMAGGALPASLDRAGVDPATLDLVAFTHLHLDHVGWATEWAVDGGRSLFPNATWLVGEGERDGAHCSDDLVPAGDRERTRTVADGEEIAPGVRAWSLPGHTSGHVAWVLDTGDGRRVVAFGDAMHSPAQVEHPDWTVFPDSDGPAAERARRRLLDELALPEVIGLGIHFADSQLGRVVDGRWTTDLG